MGTNTKKLILLDADVISHFISGGQFALLPSIFRYSKVLLDIVANELRASKKFKNYIDNVIATGFIKEINFQGNKQIAIEYAKLIKTFGKGESACMAYCKFNKDILASSNLRDISKYCEDNNITYLTTMDFLIEALHANQLTEQECDIFIKNVKAVGSKLPVDKINEYLTKFNPRSI
ncbi:MAG: hypothetical protein Q8862_03610 [Bacteroidota bacterium]|nr:hypothetical protein [Bacteroidota bacterium]